MIQGTAQEPVSHVVMTNIKEVMAKSHEHYAQLRKHRAPKTDSKMKYEDVSGTRK